jgi:hypothetical protein
MGRSRGGAVQERNWFILCYTRIGYLGYDNSFFVISYGNQKYKLTFRDFREADVAINPVDFILFVEAPGQPPR